MKIEICQTIAKSLGILGVRFNFGLGRPFWARLGKVGKGLSTLHKAAHAGHAKGLLAKMNVELTAKVFADVALPQGFGTQEHQVCRV
jgi:hypothetical protein